MNPASRLAQPLDRIKGGDAEVPYVPRTDVGVDAAAVAGIALVRQEELRERRGREIPVAAVPARRHQPLCEVHRDEPLVHLGQTFLF